MKRPSRQHKRGMQENKPALSWALPPPGPTGTTQETRARLSPSLFSPPLPSPSSFQHRHDGRKAARKTHSTLHQEGSLYPAPHPPGSRVLVHVPGSELTTLDRIAVVCSSLMIVGSVAWVPVAYAWLWRRWSRIPKDQKARRIICASLLAGLTALVVIGPHKHKRVGDWLKVRSWRLWKSWMRFVAMEVVLDHRNASKHPPLDPHQEKAIVAITPHGIFPFSLAMAAISNIGTRAFGPLRPVVASATNMIPFVRSLLGWMGCM